MIKTCHQCHVQLAEDHIGPKYCSTECAERRRAGNRERLARWNAKHPGGGARHSREWRKRHSDRLRDAEKSRREVNRAKIRDTAKRSYWSNVDDRRMRGRRKALARYAADPARARERSRLWRAANPQKVKDMNHKWQVANRDRKARIESNRRALKKDATGTYSFVEWQAKCAEHGGVCFYCGKSTRMTADHVVPLSRGGTNRIENIVPACIRCNSGKKDADPAEWIQRRLTAGRPVTAAAMALLDRLRELASARDAAGSGTVVDTLDAA